MAKTRSRKTEELKVLQDKLGLAKSIVFAKYDRLKVSEVEALRKNCRAGKVDYLVVKKTLLKKSLKEQNFENEMLDAYRGGIAAAFGYADEVAPAKILNDFSQEHEALEFLGGFLNGAYVGKDQLLALAKLPSKQELLAKMVGSLKAPVSGLVNVLAGNIRGLVQVLNAICKSKS